MRFDFLKYIYWLFFSYSGNCLVMSLIHFCYGSCEGYFEGFSKRYHSFFFFFCLLMYDHFFPRLTVIWIFYVVHFACKINTISRFSFTFPFLIAIAQNTFLNRALQKSRIGFFSLCVCIHGVAKSRTRLSDWSDLMLTAVFTTSHF